MHESASRSGKSRPPFHCHARPARAIRPWHPCCSNPGAHTNPADWTTGWHGRVARADRRNQLGLADSRANRVFLMTTWFYPGRQAAIRQASCKSTTHQPKQNSAAGSQTSTGDTPVPPICWFVHQARAARSSHPRAGSQASTGDTPVPPHSCHPAARASRPILPEGGRSMDTSTLLLSYGVTWERGRLAVIPWDAPHDLVDAETGAFNVRTTWPSAGPGRGVRSRPGRTGRVE